MPDFDMSDVLRDAMNDPSHPANHMSGNPEGVDMTRLVESILPLLEEVHVHPWTFLLALTEHIAEDEYGRGGFDQYNIRDAEGDLWGVTVGLADEDD